MLSLSVSVFLFSPCSSSLSASHLASRHPCSESIHYHEHDGDTHHYHDAHSLHRSSREQTDREQESGQRGEHDDEEDQGQSEGMTDDAYMERTRKSASHDREDEEGEDIEMQTEDRGRRGHNERQADTQSASLSHPPMLTMPDCPHLGFIAGPPPMRRQLTR